MEILFVEEFKRKAIHLVALSVPIGYYFLPKRTALLILIPIVLIILAGDIIRLKELPGSNLIKRIFGAMLRDHESADLSGASYILSGATLTIAAFSKPVALAALGFIILGDIAAALVGRKYGRIKIGDKTLEGSLTFFGMSVLVAILVPDFSLVIGIIGALVATIIEALTLPVDDNLIVPLISGLVMQILAAI